MSTDYEYDEIDADDIYQDEDGDPYMVDENGRVLWLEEHDDGSYSVLGDDNDGVLDDADVRDGAEQAVAVNQAQWGAWVDDTFNREAVRFAREIGRGTKDFGGEERPTAFTSREVEALREAVAHQVGRGLPIDMVTAAREAKVYDPRSSDREAFRRWTHERYADLQATPEPDAEPAAETEPDAEEASAE